MEMYDGIAESCLRRADGDQQKADYLYNCPYWEYYYRIMQYNRLMEKKKKPNEITG
jgi:hypothetical protein